MSAHVANIERGKAGVNSTHNIVLMIKRSSFDCVSRKFDNIGAAQTWPV